jgi:hypothetical protein
MNQAPTPMRLFRFLRSRSKAPPQDDAADMGTAWGLDMSFDPPQETGEAAASVPPLPAMHRGWLRRLAARRQAAG